MRLEPWQVLEPADGEDPHTWQQRVREFCTQQDLRFEALRDALAAIENKPWTVRTNTTGPEWNRRQATYVMAADGGAYGELHPDGQGWQAQLGPYAYDTGPVRPSQDEAALDLMTYRVHTGVVRLPGAR